MRKLLLLHFLLGVTGWLPSLSAQCDLELSMTVSNSFPAIYTNVDYVLILHNNGPETATNISVRAPHSLLISANGLVYTGSNATAGSYDNITLTWNIPALSAGGTATLTLTLFTMQTGLPPVYAQVSGASPGDADSQPNNGTQPVVAEDDEALVDVSVTQPCNINLSFVDVACVPASPGGPPEDYYQYKILATSTDPAVEFIEIAQNADFLGKYIVEPGVPFSPPFSTGFYHQASSPTPYWARPANNPGCVVKDTSSAPPGCGVPIPPNNCNLYFYFNDVFCHNGGYGFSITAQKFGEPLNGSYTLYINDVSQGSYYTYGEQYNFGLFGPLTLPTPGVGDVVRVVSNLDPACSSESLVYPENYCNLPPNTPCNQRAVFPWHEWISRVQFDGIDQESGKSTSSDFRLNGFTPGGGPGYATVHAGQSVPISITVNYSYLAYPESIRVWLDKNHDGIFEDPTDIIFEGQMPVATNGPNASSTLQTDVLIPADAVSGATSLKVALQRGSYPSACDAIPFGEVEYYSVKILDGQASSAPCDAASFTVLGVECYDPGTPDGAGDDLYYIRYRVDLPGAEGLTVQTSGNWIDAQGNFIFPPQNVDPFYTLGTVGQDAVYGPILISQFPHLTFRATIYDPSGFLICYNLAPVVVDAPGACSNGILPAPTPDCSASSGFPWEDWISGVKIGTYEKISGKSYFSDFSAETVQLVQESSTPVALTASFSYSTYDEYWRIWIDFNHNGLFETPGEVACEGISARPQDGTPFKVFNGNIVVPASALVGPARARVIMRRNAFAQPCGTQPYGEVEDYTVNIAQNLQAAPIVRSKAISPADLADFTLFPNPAGETFFVKMPALTSPVSMALINQIGLLEKAYAPVAGLTKSSTDNDTRIIELDLSNVKNGVYFLKMETPGSRPVTKKLVVHKAY